MVCAIIVAAGKGTRMGPKMDKLFVEIKGSPVAAYTWGIFNSASFIDRLVIVVRDGMQAAFAKLAQKYHFNKPFELVAGGVERQDSVCNGLMVLPPETEIVVIQDAARPCTTLDLIFATITAAREM